MDVIRVYESEIRKEEHGFVEDRDYEERFRAEHMRDEL